MTINHEEAERDHIYNEPYYGTTKLLCPVVTLQAAYTIKKYAYI